MNSPWLILTTRYGDDVRSPTADDLRIAIREMFDENLPGMTEGDYAEHGSAHLRYGHDEGPMFVVTVSREGAATFEQWADQDYEVELSPCSSQAISEANAIELWNTLASGDVDQLKAAFAGGRSTTRPKVASMREAICESCIARASEPQTERITSLFSEAHEGASLSECRDCAQSYVIYSLENRDDLIQYSCPVSDEESESIRTSTDQRNLIRSIVRGRSVFFRAPWTAGWEDGHRVLVEPRPW